jgi:Protein of unknown function (DUF2934)
LDNDTRRQKQQALITELLERKIRLHARELYDQRDRAEGFALQDWVQAESEVLANSILAPLYRRTRAEDLSNEFEATTSPQRDATSPALSDTRV